MYSQPHWSGSDCTVRVYDRQVCRHCLSHSLLRSLLLTSQQNVCYGYALRRRYTSKVIPGNIFRIRTHWRLVTKPRAASLQGACQAWVQRCDRWHHHNKSFTIKEAFAIRPFGTQMNLATERITDFDQAVSSIPSGNVKCQCLLCRCSGLTDVSHLKAHST